MCIYIYIYVIGGAAACAGGAGGAAAWTGRASNLALTQRSTQGLHKVYTRSTLPV